MEHRELMLLFSDLFDAICNEIARKEGWNEYTDWNEHSFMEVEPLTHEDDQIDGVLFFADGTVEFHLKRKQDALNWCTFPPKTIEDVLARLRHKI